MQFEEWCSESRYWRVFRLLSAGFSPLRPGVAPRAVHVRFVVDEVALKQVFLRVPWLSIVIIIPPILHFQSCVIWGMENGPVSGPASQRHCITPSQQ
jgi:hypothetical protein